MSEKMADKSRKNRMKRTESTESNSKMGKSLKERNKVKKPKERWLLTRKTWRYMTDAGRKLIPDGTQNRLEDIPKIEAYFQEVCKKEPRFLLWRKNSYPGALGFRKKRKDIRKGGSCRKANSSDDVDNIAIKPERPKDLALIPSTSGGRFDIQKMKYDFLNSPSPTSPRSALKVKEVHSSFGTKTPSSSNEDDEKLINMLQQYLTLSQQQQQRDNNNSSTITSNVPGDKYSAAFDYQDLVDRLHRHLTLTTTNMPIRTSTYNPFKREGVHFEGDHVQKSLTETLSRYFSQTPNRDRVISDLLTDRKTLEKLYFDLRKTKGFKPRAKDYSTTHSKWSPSLLRRNLKTEDNTNDTKATTVQPPLIEIQSESYEPRFEDEGTQTYTIPEQGLIKIDEDYRKILLEKEEENRESKFPSHRRRSSVDNDDVSQSVSDTIKRYLRMARKKSVDSDKVDRFKRVNYDRNLRNIKAKGEITKPGDDDGLNKGCQTNDDWILTYRDYKFDNYYESDSRLSSNRSSIDASYVDENNKPSHSSFKSTSQSFISNLLHGKHSHDNKSTSPATVTTGATSTGTGSSTMQKSKSSSSVMHHGSRLVAKKIFRSRSKSQTRPSVAHCSWTPQGSRLWTNVTGKQVILNDTNLLQLSEVERKVLQKVALAKLQALNLGVAIKIPSENPTQVVTKPKRRPYLLRKARTTSIFDASRKEVEKESSTSGGLVFGIPLSQCVENDRLSRGSTVMHPFRRNPDEMCGESGDESTTMGRNDSRASFSSLIDPTRVDEKGSYENLLTRERMVGSVPGLLDRISTSSTADIPVDVNINEEPSVPNILNVCIRHLENNGLRTLGIFRVSTSKRRIRQLREDFDCGKETSLEDEQCPHDVATLLKEYLRDLPDPLLCRDLYQAFVNTQRIRHRKLQFEALQHLIQLLPPSNRDTLWTLLNFLDNVAKNSNDSIDSSGNANVGNKMDSNNLATVFAPNILHSVKPGSKENPNEKIEDRTDVINVIRALIDYNRELFYIPAELLDEVYIHMMDSHPECLDEILNKKETLADESQDDIDSESNSATWTPTASSAGVTFEHSIKTYHLDNDGRDTPPERKKTYSREECLHETAATGGPNVAMRIRHKDKIRERSMKKKREESSARKRKEDDSPTMSSARSIISRFRGQKDEDGFSKTRSSSLESSSSHADSSEIARILRISDEPQITDRRKSSPYIPDASGVITASLTIPVQTNNQALSVVDDDIQYIDDGTNDGKQQMTIGLVRTPTAPPRRRQRSISGSDSSIASNIHQAITGTISLTQGYDSAMGSSATYSSPPHNTTPSSISSADHGIYSSPPSWASTPPTSPDSVNTSVNYIPDDMSSKGTTRGPMQRSASKEMPTLQKVSIITTPELQQIRSGKPANNYQRPIQNNMNNNNNNADVQKSYSTPSFSGMESITLKSHEQKFTPSITSIGNAVLRSKTADFERISNNKTDVNKSVKPTAQSTTTSNDKKKYTKRRYTDTRHQTQHIPDSQTLEATTSANKKKEEKTAISQTVYKRRELISSVPTK